MTFSPCLRVCVRVASEEGRKRKGAEGRKLKAVISEASRLQSVVHVVVSLSLDPATTVDSAVVDRTVKIESPSLLPQCFRFA